MPSTHAKNTKQKRLGRQLTDAGSLFIAAGLILGLFIYAPIIKQELRYIYSDKGAGAVVEKHPGNEVVTPVSSELGIVIPKISANAIVVPDIDPQDPQVYQQALTKGVAHAKGSALPGENGNVFLFAHSAVDFYAATRYNAIFYLLTKLQKDDDIYIFYKGDKYRYSVIDAKKVPADSVEYLQKGNLQTLTLMTCWPPGTTWQRYLVTAKLVSNY